jgi:hypothetical protein
LSYAPSALAQQLVGRYYPEKRDYLVGEPVIVVFEVTNNSAETVQIGEGGCAWLNQGQFEVDHATPRKRFTLFGCGGGIGGSCGGTLRQIPAGGMYQQRLLLDGDFTLESPGNYHVHAKREQRVTGTGAGEPSIDLKVDSEFDLILRTPTEDELLQAYQPLLRDLQSQEFAVRSLAARAVTQNPPRFAESAILGMTDDAILKYTSVDGLKRLATPAARTQLLLMSSITSPESLRQQTIPALGEVGNPDDCQAMLNIAGESTAYAQIQAYVAAGRICKQSAIAVLGILTRTADPPLLGGLAFALKNTSSRDAVPLLISLLENPDHDTHRDTADALALITHRQSNYGTEDLDQAIQSHDEWLHWWSESGSTAPLYNPNVCVPPQRLP